MLVTVDVKTLYTSASNNEGIASMKKKYDPNLKAIASKIKTIFQDIYSYQNFSEKIIYQKQIYYVLTLDRQHFYGILKIKMN